MTGLPGYGRASNVGRSSGAEAVVERDGGGPVNGHHHAPLCCPPLVPRPHLAEQALSSEKSSRATRPGSLKSEAKGSAGLFHGGGRLVIAIRRPCAAVVLIGFHRHRDALHDVVDDVRRGAAAQSSLGVDDDAVCQDVGSQVLDVVGDHVLPAADGCQRLAGVV